MPTGLYLKARYPPKRRAAKADFYHSAGSAWPQELRNVSMGSSVSIRSPRRVRKPHVHAKGLLITVNFCVEFFAGEETKNPKRDIPMAIVASLFLSTLAYCGIATVLTLMWPYYSQVCFRYSLSVRNLRMVLIKISGPRSTTTSSLRKPGNADDQVHSDWRGNIRFMYQVRLSGATHNT